jgi:predicted dehydrogenase
MRICIIGCSGHTNYVLSGISDPDENLIVGVAPGSQGEDTSGLLQQCSAKGHAPGAFGAAAEMLDELEPDVAVVNCHFGDHARNVAEVLQRKIHVFVEKPIATTLEDLAMLKEQHASSGVHLAAMFGIRYEGAIRAAQGAVARGAVGAVRLVTAQKSYKLGTRRDFCKTRETYGGTIPWVGAHAIDWIRWLSGEEFTSVRASHSVMHNRGNGDLEISAACHFTMTNEVIGAANIDLLRPAGAESHGDDRVRVAGADGVVEARGGTAYLINGEAKGTQELPPVEKGQIFADFLAQVRGEGTCLISAEDSFKVTEACLLARQSADEKREVAFPV